MIFCRLLDIGVPQIMKTMSFQACFFQYFLQLFPYGRLRKVTSIRVGEYQVWKSSIAPCRTDFQPLQCLGFFVLFQNFHNERSRG